MGDADFISDNYGIRMQPNQMFLLNMLDWSLLDNDMISIRSRGSTSRTLEEVDPWLTRLIEILNYAVPIALVILIWVIRFIHRKRQALESLVMEGGKR